MTITIKFLGIPLECHGYYTPYRSSTYIDPPEPASFEIDEVFYRGVEVMTLLDALHIDWHDIERKCLEALEE